MLLTGWRQWLKRLSSSSRISRDKRRRKPRRKLHLETLETRLAPAIRTWTGTISNLWSDQGNWQNNKAPNSGDDLIFPANTQHQNTFNDFADNTNFHSITFSGGGYSISGHGIILGQGIGGTLVDSSGATNN